MQRVIMAAACAALMSCARPPAPPANGASAPPQELAVANAANAHVTLAAEGSRVAAAWTASTDAGVNVFAALSTDGGRTFGAPVRVNDADGDARANGEQPPRIVMKTASIAVVWVSKQDGASVIRAAESSDGGRTFSRARSISPSGLSGARGWESATIADDGAVHAVWLDGRHSSPTPPGAKHAHGAMRQDIVHAVWRGSDGPLVETPIAANVCFCCKTAVAARGSDLFVAWRHIFPGGIRDIALARSTDGGRTFADPVRVSPDDWKLDACPDDGPSLALAADGAIRVAWPTLLDDGKGPRMAIFEAESRDGGATFSPRARVDLGAGSASHPRIVTSVSGARAIVWDEQVDGRRRVMIRAGETEPASIADGIVSYPAIADSAGAFVTAWTDQAGGRSVIRVTRIGPSSSIAMQ